MIHSIFRVHILFLSLCSVILLSSCTTVLKKQLTRTEEDRFTITVNDTTVEKIINNPPGPRDNGIIFPSPTTKVITHTKTQYDSTSERYYPNFIRAGLFEGVGLLGTSSPSEGFGSGLFGVFGIFDPEFGTINRNEPRDVLFTGGLYRFGIFEWQLRWFRDAKHWTVGTSAVEMIVPEVDNPKSLVSIFPIYIRKRFYLRESIPYIAITPAFGFGYFPSQYGNASVSLDFGSIGGLNFRIYAGLAAGINLANSSLNSTSASVSSTIPYIGLGTSVLDFLNKPEELDIEWKNHEHSSWSVGLLSFSINMSSADTSLFGYTQVTSRNRTTSQGQPGIINGFSLRVAPVTLALPFIDKRVFIGTSLLHLGVLGAKEIIMSVFPLRAGYWHTLIQDELILEPSIEYTYYPSRVLNVSAACKLAINEYINLQLTGGVASGNPGNSVTAVFDLSDGDVLDFTTFYLGFGIGINERLFKESELRYSRKK
ncbi:MAG: hypothetical protein IPK11_04700 [Ignavibacteria bacterium]|nr:hypothetical protein [Ignavibacteria bacterium]